MIALWIGIGVYFGIALAALVPAVGLAMLGGKNADVYRAPLWALFWPVSLVVLVRANWKILRGK